MLVELEASMSAPKVLLVCSGLDHAHRGYESFARECFEQLRHESGIVIELAKASGVPGPDEVVVPTLRRDSRLAEVLGQALRRQPFRVEAAVFGLGLQRLLTRSRPDVVYLSEWDTARVLAALRAARRQKFGLLLCNGGFAERGFDHLDQVQELTPAALEHVVRAGADPSRHSMLPLGFNIARELEFPSELDRAALRAKWQLPKDRHIVISVAALNHSHKRLDYLIEELAQVPEPRPFGLFVGEAEAETPELMTLAARQLGDANHRFLSVRAAEVPELLRASDVFVLASLSEMQGRAIVEAMSEGLPCLIHDNPVMRFAVGDLGARGDFGRPGSLTELLVQQRAAPRNVAEARARHEFAYQRFSWDELRPRYVELFRAVAEGTANSTVSSSTGEKDSR